ncbi:thermonuclease family protein [Hyphomicrobium sulfonivorans]|uniref:thermonuclease family protein n=1 Tax=Hyphomicrobium sulfonivorans TaxID=121290 RepID=UPI000837F810|nr:thermonuclease family protein [Hyphomicrobium sulfonivorans]
MTAASDRPPFDTDIPTPFRGPRTRASGKRRAKGRRRSSSAQRLARARRAKLQFWGGVLLACLGFAAIAAWERYNLPVGEMRSGPVPLCSSFQRNNCIIDGDTGRDQGEKWRLIAIDTPEISDPGCENERVIAIAARNRLRDLLVDGYRLRSSGRKDPHGRNLVDIELTDGRDVSRILLDEGLAQRWPNRGNIWCDRYTSNPVRKRG